MGVFFRFVNIVLVCRYFHNCICHVATINSGNPIPIPNKIDQNTVKPLHRRYMRPYKEGCSSNSFDSDQSPKFSGVVCCHAFAASVTEELHLQLENIRYKIYRCFFQRDSKVFASIFALPTGPGHGSSEYNTIRLTGVTVRNFDLFLSTLYPALVYIRTY